MNQRARAALAGLLAACAALGSAQVAPSTPAPVPASPSPPPKPRARAVRPPPGPPDVYFLAGGDRVTGQTIARRKRDFRVRTPYGVLTLPRDKVERVLWAGTREEWLHEPAPEPEPPPTPPPPATLVLTVVGQSFWHAWDRREPVDPTLRLRVLLDSDELATYVDAQLDPQDLPGATVNSFAFDSVETVARAAATRDVRPGRITLRLTLPPDALAAGDATRRLRLAYQVNAGTRAAPDWRDAAVGEVDARLALSRTTSVELRQDAGRMEFSGFGRKRMKQVETFRLGLHASPPE